MNAAEQTLFLVTYMVGKKERVGCWSVGHGGIMLAMLCIQVRLRVFRGLRGTGFEPVGRDGLVVVASRYGPYGSVIQSGWGRDFPHRFRAALVPIHLPTQWVPGQSRW